MPSFDIVSKIEPHELENALNNTRKAIMQRYDFRGSPVEITHDAKANTLSITAADKMKSEAVKEILQQQAVKRGLDLKVLKFDEAEPAAGTAYRRTVHIQQGIPQDVAKNIVKQIKESKIKVQASIQGEEVRVNGKKIDDLQSVIQMLKADDKIGVPLQFVNMKS
ncbi:YajQ family cyclic di-GMP-binding protein [Planctomycetales bacterium ZRK34]|nr:YajQ family cyclic di-GMP-binding protein [Planctomycetales bacterium ZRK34]